MIEAGIAGMVEAKLEEIKDAATAVEQLVQTEAEAIAKANPASAAVAQPEILPQSEAVIDAPTPKIVGKPTTASPPVMTVPKQKPPNPHPLREWQKRKLAKELIRK